MAKQYRLKITWSNGDSEYVGEQLNSKEVHELMCDFMIKDIKPFEDKVYFMRNARKLECQEYIQEKEIKL